MANFTVTITGKADDFSTLLDLESAIKTIAPYMVDNVTVGVEIRAQVGERKE